MGKAGLLHRKPRPAHVTGGEVLVRVPKNHMGQAIMEQYMARFNVAQCGRRLGKTTFGKRRALRTVLRGQPYGWFAPTYKLLSDAWRDMNRRLAPVIRDKSETEKRIELINGGVLEMWTLDGPDAGRGKDYAEVGIDEAGLVRDLKERWENDIRPTLALMRGRAWFLGTPKGRRYFHTLYEKGYAEMTAGVGQWAAFRMPSILNPRMTQDEVDNAQRELPPDAFKQEYLGEPADDAGNPFGLVAIAACALPNVEVSANETYRVPPQHRARARYCAGIDLARAEDYTDVHILDVDTGHTVALDHFRLPWEVTVPRIGALINEYRASYTIDATGVGDKVARDVMKACVPQGELFVFTAPSKQALMERLMTALHRKEVRYPSGWLVDELESFGYEYTKYGVRYEAPQGLHDDGVVGLALSVHARDRARLMAGMATENFRTVRR